MRKRAAIELSANALVIIIISTVILIFSIVLVRNLVTGGDVAVGQLDKRTQQAIEAFLVDPAARVALPVTTRQVSRGEIAGFGLGVKNVLGDANDFYVDIACDAFIAKGAATGYSCAPYLIHFEILGLWLENAVTIGNTKEHSYPIQIKMAKNAPSGTYIFNVKVCYNGAANDYCTAGYQTSYIDGGIKKIYVIVK